ncbi:MAG TPA: carboxymuconolactone decarboxylase family protein, partial [Caulobacteraceae bacterium]|nr:carboxymuconolactone decarboxylase family protein [Caulobacteraceae bacterium]
MRLSAPRIAPLRDDEMTDEQRQALAPMSAGGRPVLNIFRTLVRAPKALARFNEWGSYVLSRRNSLPPREREIVILRVGFLCKSGYEFTQHTRIGLAEGLSADEIARIKA